MAFNIPSQWGAGKATPVSAPISSWTRPVDWPIITDTPNEVYMLVSDRALLTYAMKTRFTRPGGQNVFIDWGDGTVDMVTTEVNTWTTHTYAAGTGTPCSQGYTTWVVRVYSDPGAVINEAIIDANGGVSMPYAVNQMTLSTGVLEVYFGDGVQITSFGGYFTQTNRGVFYNFLQYVKFPYDCAYNLDPNFFANTFDGSVSNTLFPLGKVVMPVRLNPGLTYSFTNTFYGAPFLTEVTLPVDCRVSDYSATFQNCRSLQKVTLPTLSVAHNSLTTTANMFNGCSLLNEIVNFPTSLPAITTINSMFKDCKSLNSIVIPDLSSVGTVITTGAFSGCTSLRSIVWLGNYASASTKFDTAASMFNGCSNLESIRFPEGLQIGNANAMFQTCTSLKSAIFPNSCSTLTDMGSCFASCTDLQEVTLPSSISTPVIFSLTFSSCPSLESITLPSGGTITNLASTFSGCTSLKTVTLPTSLTSCTSIASLFSACSSLRSVSFPNDMSAVVAATSVFQNCSALQSVTMPTTIGATTSINSFFNGCSALTGSIAFPALGSCVSFSSVFQNCRSLRSVTFSTVSASTTTWASAFAGCNGLETVTLPVTSMTAITSTGLNNMFQNCSNLRTINNIDKLGAASSTTLIALGSSNGTFSGIYQLTSTLSLSCRLSIFNAGGVSAAPNKVQAVRFLATNTGQWTGVSPQINVSYTSMSTAALVDMFNDMAAQGTVTSKTVDITGTPGAPGLTTADRLIVTSKGWTITG